MNVQDQPHVKMTERLPPASARRPMQDGPVPERRAAAPAPYQGFDGQYINGSWPTGRHGGVQIDTNTGIELFGRHRAAPCRVMRSAPSPQKRLYPKTITVFLDASPSGRHRAVYAAALAQRWDAHVIGVHVVFAGVRLDPPAESWAIGERAFQAVIAHEKRLRANAEAVAADVSEYFQDLCTRWNVAGELRRIDSHRPAQEAILNAFHSDLAIVGHPEPNGLPDDVTLETILLASGVPLLVLPNAWLGEAIGNNVLIGWNASRKGPAHDIRRDAVSCRRTGGHHASRGSVQRPPTRRGARCRHRLAIGAAWCASQRGTRDVERLSDRGGDPRSCRAERIGPARIWSLWSLSVAGTFARGHNANLARANACPRICFDITHRARIVEFSRRHPISIGEPGTFGRGGARPRSY